MSDATTPRAGLSSALQRGQAARANINSFIVMDVMSAAQAQEARGVHVIHMEVGQPATAAPKAARRAVADALERETLGYTLALGREELRARIAGLYKRWYGLDLDPGRVVVTSGSSAAFLLSFLSVFDVGQTVGLPNPGYPCYRHILTTLGIHSHLLATDAANRWMPTAAQIAHEAERANLAGVLLASPANPTGTMLEPARLGEIVRLCDERGLWFISDEIYHGLTYGVPEATALQFSDNAIVINSFSKYFSMTGWRVGWMVVPDRLVRTVERLAQNLFISPPAVSQVAAIGAFEGLEECEANKRVYAQNRDILLTGLPEAGFETLVPADGAFYLYADVSHLTQDSLAFAKSILEETGVAVTPGLDFDPVNGRKFIRFSYARSSDDMLEAVRRLKIWKQARR